MPEPIPSSPAGLVTRFAPSPTGDLHLGHAASALDAWRRARVSGGRFLLRIEDIDPIRCRPEHTEALLADLTWLGLNWDAEPLRQSQRLALYAACLSDLKRRGLLYPCFCSRTDIAREIAAAAAAPHDPDGGPIYPGTCRLRSSAERAARIEAGAPHAWRLDMAAALATAPPLFFHDERQGHIRADPARFGDVVLGRRDVPASYHLCVTHDDAAQAVTLVTRAEDLLSATHLHRLLQHLFAWPIPAYAHHQLLRDETGRKLSKRDGALSIRALRDAGWQPADVLSQAAAALRLTV
jgi:glutamyl-Q tRNA(Asp) synthetase